MNNPNTLSLLTLFFLILVFTILYKFFNRTTKEEKYNYKIYCEQQEKHWSYIENKYRIGTFIIVNNLVCRITHFERYGWGSQNFWVKVFEVDTYDEYKIPIPLDENTNITLYTGNDIDKLEEKYHVGARLKNSRPVQIIDNSTRCNHSDNDWDWMY